MGFEAVMALPSWSIEMNNFSLEKLEAVTMDFLSRALRTRPVSWLGNSEGLCEISSLCHRQLLLQPWRSCVLS
ncbi:hypothetical protein LOK49_LG04G00783 [Camellia lanceoleosa]|uniref:Uncharacterized protein n=1 Tax=Camellia lanceoleosa TaxID=1840588 RepID=A0ACC0I373_9ERIC|nr:hypothetical protein LOK49_LG04G00783 [Camellia lanceoleosa]